jgi:hypothetical protein
MRLQDELSRAAADAASKNCGTLSFGACTLCAPEAEVNVYSAAAARCLSHPQPACPSSFASASDAQHASLSAGAGPPQHPTALGRVPVTLQTPVSGKTRSIRPAAS